MVTTVIKLGGCNGSGKSSVARAMLPGFAVVHALRGEGGAIEGYDINTWAKDTIILGRYENACGGMDAMGQKEEIRALFHKYIPRKRGGIVFFEGLITGKTYGYMGEQLKLLGDKGKVRTLWAFMGTPFEECVARVEKRRAEAAAAKGKEPAPFDPERTLRQTFTIMERLEEGVRSGKYPIVGEVLRLPARGKPETLARKLLDKAMEMHRAAN